MDNYVYDKSYIAKYHRQIKEGTIRTGKWIRKVYDIIEKGVSNGSFFYNDKKARKAIRFIESYCHHSKGRSDLIKLELWQKALISCIFGIVNAEGYRQFREVFIVIARKNGKSLLASAILAYMAFLDKEY